VTLFRNVARREWRKAHSGTLKVAVALHGTKTGTLIKFSRRIGDRVKKRFMPARCTLNFTASRKRPDETKEANCFRHQKS
jgi:hypothetical protein